MGAQSHKIDVARLYAELNDCRASLGLSWREIGRDLEISNSTFSRLAKGHSPSASAFARLVHWLGEDAESYMETDRPQAPLISETGRLRSIAAQLVALADRLDGAR